MTSNWFVVFPDEPKNLRKKEVTMKLANFSKHVVHIKFLSDLLVSIGVACKITDVKRFFRFVLSCSSLLYIHHSLTYPYIFIS